MQQYTDRASRGKHRKTPDLRYTNMAKLLEPTFGHLGTGTHLRYSNMLKFEELDFRATFSTSFLLSINISPLEKKKVCVFYVFLLWNSNHSRSMLSAATLKTSGLLECLVFPGALLGECDIQTSYSKIQNGPPMHPEHEKHSFLHTKGNPNASGT